MASDAPQSVGLGGDGDEIAAIEEVENAFGVRLDNGDAPDWHTAGDVFASLRKALPPEEAQRSDLWQRFTVALTRETGVDPTIIQPNSPLLAEGLFWARIADASAVLWGIIIIGLALVVVLSLL